MEKLVIIAFAIVGILAAFVLAYGITTSKIIKDQERELAALKTENKRLKKRIAEASVSHNPDPAEPSIIFTVVNSEGKKVLERLFEQW